MTLILEVATPPFERARSTFLLSARFACLVALALPSAAGAVDVAADSLVWGHALIDANAISAPLANLECVDDLHFSLQLSKATINRAGIAGLARHGRKARWAGGLLSLLAGMNGPRQRSRLHQGGAQAGYGCSSSLFPFFSRSYAT